MRNRSLEYLTRRGTSLKRKKTHEQKEIEEVFSQISSELESLKELVGKVEKECMLYCAPGFTSKAGIAKRIDEHRYAIAVTLSKAKGLMETFSQTYEKSFNPSLINSISTHFHYKLDALVFQMNGSLCCIEEARTAFPDLGERVPSDSDKATIEGVYKSVYFITTVIRELKSVVLSQSDKIERLDCAMDLVAHSAKKSSKEISSISTFGSQIKNRVITVLFFSIFILIVLSTLKAYSYR
ncbi:hypothetical protein NECID01_0587 [Nematocida sp. AWRm77]|nr:hypothetical protein NECID01_0587 [Nematocida sp. AWRm77]